LNNNNYALDNSDSVVLVSAESFHPAVNSIKANLPKLTKIWYAKEEIREGIAKKAKKENSNQIYLQ
jgi:hypothetical protein